MTETKVINRPMRPRADYAKCEGIACARRETCLRWLRPAGEYQVWAAFYAALPGDCGGYWPPREVDPEARGAA